MLRRSLKRILASRAINPLVRAGARHASRMCSRVAGFLGRRIPVSGTFRSTYAGVTFDYFAEGDDVVADLLYFDQNPERDEVTLFAGFARRSEVILDVGANTGLYSVVGSRAHPEARIFAFEPHPANFRRLECNLALNHAENVEALAQAVGAASGTVSFTVPADGAISMVSSPVHGFAAAFYPEPPRQITVSSVSLDDFVRERQLDRVDLVKIDVEYYEEEVLAGMVAILDRFSPVLLCEVFVYDFVVENRPELRGQVDPKHHEAIEERLRQAGYSFYAVSETGLVRMETLFCPNHCSDFVFSRVRSKHRFLPYREMDKLCAELSEATGK